jgi:hypothetical protein
MKSAERFAGHRQDLARKVHEAGIKNPQVLQAIATVPMLDCTPARMRTLHYRLGISKPSPNHRWWHA